VGVDVSFEFESRREESINGWKKGANIEGICRALVGVRKRERYVMAVGRILQPVSPVLESWEEECTCYRALRAQKTPCNQLKYSSIQILCKSMIFKILRLEALSKVSMQSIGQNQVLS